MKYLTNIIIFPKKLKKIERKISYFFMTYYFHNCYVHIKSLFIWKYINFKN